MSFWQFYNKVNQLHEQPSEQTNQKKFLARLSLPIVLQTESNQRNILTLIDLTEDLKIQIRSSAKKCCCLNFDDLIFGRLDQAKFILMETFDGKHFMVDGPDGNQIDCMFFPCTNKEEIQVDDSVPIDGRTQGRRG